MSALRRVPGPIRAALRPLYRRVRRAPAAPQEALPDAELAAFLEREGYLDGYGRSPKDVTALVRIKDESGSGEPQRDGGYTRRALEMKDHELLFAISALSRHLPDGGRVVDIASGSSTLPAIYAALGYDAVHHDVHPLAYPDPALEDITCDVMDLAAYCPAESFDAATMICAMEHFGLGRYGDRPDGRGDFQAVSSLTPTLKQGGLLILTVPFGEPAVVFNTHRVYDHERLRSVLGEFDILDEQYRLWPDWRTASRTEAEAIELTRTGKRPGANHALALWVARKR